MTIRLDKWLWAARFFKTRNLARDAIDGGKVHVDGQRAKPSKIVSLGLKLSIRQGDTEKIVIVKALSELRGPAAAAVMLYEETPESVSKRDQLREQHKLMQSHSPSTPKRPNKKQRRQLMHFKQNNI